MISPVLAYLRLQRICWVLLLSGVPWFGFAVEQDTQVWSTVHLNGKLGDDVSANLELQARLTEDAAALGQQFVRPSLTYHFNDALNASVGYVHVLTNNSQVVSFRENRPWQQLGYRLYSNDAGLLLSGRTRLEQRFVGHDVDAGWRLRQQVRLELPVQAKSSTKLLTWNETFYGVNDTNGGQRAGFDQTRHFAGVAWQLAKPVSAEAGYLNQTIFTDGENRMNHAMVTMLTVRF